jgi:type IV pilus assembly protein PilO
MTVMRKWSLLTGFLVIAVVAAGWFLLVSPKRAATTDQKTQKATQDRTNSELQTQISVLKEQFANLPKQQAQLAAIRQQLPDNPQLPKLVRDLSADAKASGAFLAEIAPGLPVALSPTALAAGAPAAPVVTAAKPTVAATTTALFQVPLTLKLTGDYYELEQYISGLEQMRRAFLVTGLSVDLNQDVNTPGSLSMTVTGRVFVVATPPATTITPGAVAAPATK